MLPNKVDLASQSTALAVALAAFCCFVARKLAPSGTRSYFSGAWKYLGPATGFQSRCLGSLTDLTRVTRTASRSDCEKRPSTIGKKMAVSSTCICSKKSLPFYGWSILHQDHLGADPSLPLFEPFRPSH